MMTFKDTLRASVWKGLVLIALILSGACGGEVSQIQRSNTPTASLFLPPTATSTPSSSTQRISRQGLRVWLPPRFDPNGDQLAARLLSDRLQAFYEQFPNLPIELRIKAEDGAGGMLDALTTSAEAAPLALPDLVLLPRKIIAPLAQSGILHPLDGYAEISAEPGWYPYAHQLATIENTTFGIPFVGDVLVLAYPRSLANEYPLNWNDWLLSQYTLGFAAADAQATVLLALYLQAGGAIRNVQGRPILEEAVLTELLENLSYAARQGKLPPWVIQAENDQMVIQALKDGKVDSGYIWSSSYLKNDTQQWRASAGFLANKTSLTLADGWIWASTSPIPDQIGISFQLAAFLSEPEFMAAFAQAAAYLPTRSEAFTVWPKEDLAKELETISQLAQIIPPNSLSDPLAVALRNALLAVLKDRLPAQQAAKDAIASLNKP